MADESPQAAKKQFIGMRGASLPTGGGWENLPMTERLRQTFERGLTRVELDLADAYNKKIVPGNIPEAQKRISKQIAAEFGAKFSVHAPYQVDPSSMSWAQRTEASEVLRQSIKYAKDMGAKFVTIHPTANLSGAAFQDPFTWQANPVPAHFMVRNKQEFDTWCSNHNIKQDSPVYEKLKQEAGVMYNAQTMQYTQHYASSAPLYARDFGSKAVSNEINKVFFELRSKGVSDDATIRQNLALAVSGYLGSRNVNVSEAAHQAWNAFLANYNDRIKDLNARYAQVPDSDRPEYVKHYNEQKEKAWQLATMASGGRINKDGTTIEQNFEYDGRKDKSKDLFYGEFDPLGGKQRFNFAQAMTLNRQIDLGSEEESTKKFVSNLQETFQDLLKNPDVQRDLREGNIKLSLENLWGVNPERGITEAAGYFNKAEHMAQAVRALREVATANGLDPKCITMTFDTEHAAIGNQTNPQEFVDTLKKKFPDTEIGHVHLVGGGSTGSIFGHKGFGSVEDDIARKHPELLKKLVEMGAPITMEPGSGGIKDVEAGLETLLLGAPMEALQAAGFDKNSLPALGYASAPSPAYPSGPSYFGALAAQNEAMVTKSLYSFGPSLRQPFQATYGPFASPSLYQGGISHQAPGMSLWPTGQPLLYSMRPKE